MLHAVPGHFATSQSHINYYIDMTSLKSRSREAREVARFLQSASMPYRHGGHDRLHGWDGGNRRFSAEELEKITFPSPICMRRSMVSPETNSANQFLFRGEHPPGGGRGKTCTASDGQLTTGRDGPQESGVYRVFRWNCGGGSHSDFSQRRVRWAESQVFPVLPRRICRAIRLYAPWESVPIAKKGNRSRRL